MDRQAPRASAAGHASGFMALLEVLRAPLLLSPVSDVLAGWAVTVAVTGRAQASADLATVDGHGAPDPRALLAAAACGVLLLAAGMAQNALADRADDAARKPDRPLPRGAVSVRQVALAFALLTLGALLGGLAAPGLLPVALGIVLLTAAYHLILKPQRLAGCLTLGVLRGLDMGLGAVAAAGSVGALTGVPLAPFSPLVACGLYALYICGASLHASTDDANDGRGWSRAGLGLATLALVSLGLAAGTAPGAALVSGVVFALALVRLLVAWSRLPPPPLTGVALSNMYLLGAGLCFAAGQPAAGVVILALFVGSRRLMRVFPPS